MQVAYVYAFVCVVHVCMWICMYVQVGIDICEHVHHVCMFRSGCHKYYREMYNGPGMKNYNCLDT